MLSAIDQSCSRQMGYQSKRTRAQTHQKLFRLYLLPTICKV